MNKGHIKKILILIIAVVFIASGVALQAKEPTQSEANNIKLNELNLREIYYKSPLELTTVDLHPFRDKDCSIVFVGCNELNG